MHIHLNRNNLLFSNVYLNHSNAYQNKIKEKLLIQFIFHFYHEKKHIFKQ